MLNEHDDPSALERDVLLASSGELPWWRRPRLAWRLRREPRARALAESLDELESTLAPRTATPARSARLVAATAAALVVVALWWVARPSIDPNAAIARRTDDVDRPSRGSAPVEADHRAVARLEIASRRIGRLSDPVADLGARPRLERIDRAGPSGTARLVPGLTSTNGSPGEAR